MSSRREKKASAIQRFINGITSRRVIDFLKAARPYLRRSKNFGMKSTAAATVIRFGITIRMFGC